jgi:hypothetical protein
MMRIQQSASRLVARDTPGCLWLFGLVFVMSGTFVLVAVPLSREWATFTGWERAGILAIGIGHLGGGLWLIRHTPATRLELDRTRGTGTHRIRHPGDRRETVVAFRLADLRDVDVLEERDSDGDPAFVVRLRLADGRTLRLHGATVPTRAPAVERAGEIRRFLGLPALPEPRDRG